MARPIYSDCDLPKSRLDANFIYFRSEMECKESFKSTMFSINENFDELRRAVSFFTNNTNSEGSIRLIQEILS